MCRLWELGERKWENEEGIKALHILNYHLPSMTMKVSLGITVLGEPGFGLIYSPVGTGERKEKTGSMYPRTGIYVS